MLEAEKRKRSFNTSPIEKTKVQTFQNLPNLRKIWSLALSSEHIVGASRNDHSHPLQLRPPDFHINPQGQNPRDAENWTEIGASFY
jgi:hypothetical protein